LTRLLAALVLALLLAAAAFGADPMPAPDCHGIQITDKAGDSANAVEPSLTGNRSSDVTAAWITYDPATKKATANVRVVELTLGEVDLPFDAISWEFQFSVPSGLRYVRAYQDLTGTVKFQWAEPRAVDDDQTAPRIGGPTTGKLFPGKDGVISIDMPLQDIGAAPGTLLKALAIEVRQWVSLPAAVPTITALPLYSFAPVYDDATGRTFALAPCEVPGPIAKLAVKVAVPKLSARKLAKSKRFSVKLKGTASRLVAQLRAGSAPDAKVVGTGKLASLKGNGKLTMKLRAKVKKGSYVLAIGGRNADGMDAQATAKVKVR
jgi:hypothetical protein